MSGTAEVTRVHDPQTFSEATSWEAAGNGRFHGQLDPVWGQGRAIYGGIVGAGMVRAMGAQVPVDKTLRSFFATFAGPVEAGRVDCSVESIREGRSASFVSAEIVQAGTKRAVANATFGLSRESSLHVSGPARPDLPAPDACPEMPYLEGLTPSFTQRLEFRYAQGQFPMSGSDDSRIAGWCRFRHDDDPADAYGVLALLDAWPAPALQMLRRPAPASSITWSVDLLAERPDARLDQWWCFDSRTVFVSEGYTSFEASLWAPDGRYVARSCQLVGVFG
jgi:acyl-CoA thioesterase